MLRVSQRKGAIGIRWALALLLTFHADPMGASGAHSCVPELEPSTVIIQSAVTYMPLTGEGSGPQEDLLLIAVMVIAAALLTNAKLKNPPGP